MTGVRLAGMVAVALALVPLAAHADDRDDALKLAQRLAAPMGLGGAVVTLHALPTDLPSSIPLPRATLLGTVSHPAPKTRAVTGSGWTAVAYGGGLQLYYVAPDRDATVKAYAETLRAAGWKQVDFSKRFPIPRGGFSLAQFPRIDAWCSAGPPNAAVTISTEPADPAALDIGVDDTGLGSETLCSVSASPFQEFLRPSPLPPFSASPGITIESGANFNGNGTTSGARITSSLGLSAVFESFARQLRDAGWTPKPVSAAAGLRSQTFTKTIDGTPWVALLSIYELDPTHYAALVDASNVVT